MIRIKLLNWSQKHFKKSNAILVSSNRVDAEWESQKTIIILDVDE